jgi:hypothetical protein
MNRHVSKIAISKGWRKRERAGVVARVCDLQAMRGKERSIYYVNYVYNQEVPNSVEWYNVKRYLKE